MTSIRSYSSQRVTLYFCLLALAFSAVLFGLKVQTGLLLFEFVDETEKLVTAQMLNHGAHLYKDVFAHHGPFPYMLAHAYVKIVSATDFSLVRLVMALLALASCVSIALSPIFKCITARVWAAALYLFLLSSVWLLQGIHMLLYQQIGGFLLVIVLAQLVFPAILDAQPSRMGMFSSGLSLAFSFFAAYSFAPAAILLTLSSYIALACTKPDLRKITINIAQGAIAAIAIVFFWIIIYGDFLGYLIYHIYFNQKVYAEFIYLSPLSIINNLNISFLETNIIKATSTILLFIWIAALGFLSYYKNNQGQQDKKNKIYSIFILFFSILLVNPRGLEGFHTAGFVILNFSAISLLLAWILQKNYLKPKISEVIKKLLTLSLIASTVTVASKYAISVPHGISEENYAAARANKKPDDGDMFEFIRFATKESNGILSLPFSPADYIKANRLPASGNIYYLPWQAAYNKAPILDYKIDICKDISKNNPPVILFRNVKIWEIYSTDSYEPCVIELLKKNYTNIIKDDHFYLRNDIEKNIHSDDSSEVFHLEISQTLDKLSPIQLRLLSGINDNTDRIVRIGFQFGTYARINKGTAELRLMTDKGDMYTQAFSLMDLRDNKYHFFDITPGAYISGEITSISGSGISIYESHGTGTHSCIRYVHESGKLRITPGCPIF